MSNAVDRPVRSSEDPNPNLFQAFFRRLFAIPKFIIYLAIFIASGLLISILVEWCGLIFGWWPNTHAREMLLTEAGYLDDDLRRSFLDVSASSLAGGALAWVDAWLEPGPWRASLIDELSGPVWRNDPTIVQFLKPAYAAIMPYLAATRDITLVVTVRLSNIVLALPFLVLMIFPVVLDGICQRENRKDGGGPASATRFYRSIPLLMFTVMLPIFAYLSSPIAIHPNVIFGPMGFAIGFAVFFVISNYKDRV